MPAIKLFIPSEIFDNMCKMFYSYGCTTHIIYNKKKLYQQSQKGHLNNRKSENPKPTTFGRKNWNKLKKSLHHGDLMRQVT